MIRKLLRLLTALLLLAGAAATGAAIEAISGIHVSGVGEVRVVPDMARVTLEVRREGTDAARLKAELDEVAAAVLELAKRLDIAERQVTAAAVNVYPRYRHRPHEPEPEPDGVIASRTIEVEVKQLDALAPLIDGALEAGANGVQNVQLDASNRPELERQALGLAVDDAKQEAERMAERFGVRLGDLKHASAGSHQVEPLIMGARAEAAMAADSFAPGEMTIRRDVQATFGISR